jgi:hypothetical protein
MGAKYYWECKAYSGGVAYTIDNVQSVSFNYGRIQPTDDFQTATVQINGILPDSLPAVAKEVGTEFTVELISRAGTLPYSTFFVFTVKSLSRTYGTVSNLDTWSLNGVGMIGKISEQQLTSTYSTTAGWDTTRQAHNLLNTYGIAATFSTGSSVVSANTYAVSTFINDVVQELVRTEQGRIIDIFGVVSLLSRQDSVSFTVYCNFNDGTVATAEVVSKYSSIEFINDGDYVANTVIVEPEGLAAVSSGTTRPVLNFKTLDQTSTQATNLSAYIKNTINLNTVRPLSITFVADAQLNDDWVESLVPGRQVTVALRGTSYNCVVEGASVSASPSTTQVILQLSSAEAYRFLRLNDTVFGTLDNNRLGF